MDSSIAMKSKVLQMLEDFMMGEHGKRLQPKSAEETAGDSMGKGSLDSVLKRASEENDGIEFADDGENSFDGENCEDDEKDKTGPAGKKSPKDYFSKK